MPKMVNFGDFWKMRHFWWFSTTVCEAFFSGCANKLPWELTPRSTRSVELLFFRLLKPKKSWDDCLTWNKIENHVQFHRKISEKTVKTTPLISPKISKKSVQIMYNFIFTKKCRKNPSKLQLWVYVNGTEKSVQFTPLI